jgi:hypothetical protein
MESNDPRHVVDRRHHGTEGQGSAFQSVKRARPYMNVTDGYETAAPNKGKTNTMCFTSATNHPGWK